MLPEKAPTIKWHDNISDTKGLKRAGCKSVHTLLKLVQLRWTGHVTKMPDEQLPKKVFYGELQEGKHSEGGYKDTLKNSLQDFNIPPESWEQIPLDRAKWRCLIRKGADDYETKRICEAERKRKQRQEIVIRVVILRICKRQFRAKIGIISHQRTH